MGSDELIANLFKFSQTEQKLKRDNIQTEQKLKRDNIQLEKILER